MVRRQKEWWEAQNSKKYSEGREHPPALVPPQGPAHCPFSISAHLKDTPGQRPPQPQSPCVETI